ncbi:MULTISPECIES: PH domain-containing protein [Staphylococcus]|uniref:Membrane protein n=1 Tax=Staphylococcus nepalensis TaxID=214473 RepID=A0A291JJN5_9STAP|nr:MULTISPECIES: PH domain-containing protein [Staphylococcus]VDG66588.1 Bacterial membrane flanked domain [Lacrimispora indolis]ATH59628.1 hypothetical protein BJD96_04395 [Staphylococcus nepalensis]ATH64719.1 hypothetical protein BJG89_04735 [Staphylococcus nepalensis]AWI44076.1 hypothetical protein BJG88_04465 [Staphylococcus nepalensis]MBO1212991.1 PH domain-containing protein [Staphylococcus nepalensis]
MTNDPQFRRSPKQAISYYYIVEVFELIVSLAVIAMLIFLWNHYEWWHFLIYIFITAIVFDVLYVIVKPWLKYQYTFYRMMDHYIEIKTGFFFKKNDIVKFERTQFLERKSNPLLKRLFLDKLSLKTAGHTVDFPLLLTTDVESFESNILEFLRGADYDV